MPALAPELKPLELVVEAGPEDAGGEIVIASDADVAVVEAVEDVEAVMLDIVDVTTVSDWADVTEVLEADNVERSDGAGAS